MKNFLLLVGYILFPVLGECAIEARLTPGTPRQVYSSQFFNTGQLQSIVSYTGRDSGSVKAGIGYTATCIDSNPIPGSTTSNAENTTGTFGNHLGYATTVITGQHTPNAWYTWSPGTYGCDHSARAVGAFSFQGGGAGISFRGAGFDIQVESANDDDEEIRTLHFTMIKPAAPRTCRCGCSPILIDRGPAGFDLTGVDDPVFFDINADKIYELLSWTEAGENDAFLILDQNVNGIVDNGRELFGNATLLSDGSTAEHGYQVLEELDGNGDGVINVQDDFYWLMELWIDFNHNGISEEGEIKSLWDEGIISIRVDYKESSEVDKYGNALAFVSSATACANKACTEEREIATADVFLVNREVFFGSRKVVENTFFQEECSLLPN